jgi:phage terminase large subunit GpA-like protein
MILKIKKEHKTIWSEKQKQAWDPPREIEVSQWADDFRVLHPMTSAEPGRWRTVRTPYLKGIMDAFNDPLVEEITVMASTQIGKTEGMYNMLAYAIDQDPGPALLVMPREADARSVSYNRIKPMLESSDALRKHLPYLADDITKLEYHLVQRS